VGGVDEQVQEHLRHLAFQPPDDGHRPEVVIAVALVGDGLEVGAAFTLSTISVWTDESDDLRP
jgi:hypothetical protein